MAAIMLTACGNEENQEQNKPETPIVLEYPETKIVDTVDTYFGVEIADCYRWLEDDRSKETEEWVKAQNKVSFGYLKNIPFRQELIDRMSKKWNYERISAPFKEGDYTYFYKNDGLQNQAVIYYQKGLDGKPEVFLDPNTMSQDGTAAVSLLGSSKDGKYMAYSTNMAGSDWQVINVMEIATKNKMTDELKWVKFSGAAWKNDGFYYSRYDEPAKGKELSGKNGILFRRDSQSGALHAIPRNKSWGELNAELHKN